MRKGTLRLIELSLGFAQIAAFAQLPPSSAERPKLVDLNVVALDSHNQPVGDLTAGEFEVLDGGKPQPIVFFRHNEFRLQAAPPAGVREYSNRAAGKPPHATLILFDYLNDSLSAAGAAQTQMIHALEKLESGEDLYLYLLTRRGVLFPVHPLPASAATPPAVGEKGWTAQAKPLFERAVSATFIARPFEIDIVERVSLTFTALATLAKQLAGVPGRKNIVWISHGVPISLSLSDGSVAGGRGAIASSANDYIDFLPYIRTLSGTLDRSNVAIYAVQQTPPGMAMEGTPEARYSGMGSQDTMDQFASMTGGRYVASDVAAALHQALSDVRTSYQIGYYPPGDHWDGRFHKLRVVCKRKGVRVQSKSGYYAWPEPAAEAQDAIDAAAASPTDAAEIGLRLRATSTEKDPAAIHLEVRIDPADVALIHEGDQHSAALRVAVAGYGEGGGKAGPVESFDLHLTPAQHDQIVKNGIVYERNLRLADAIRQVRFIVFDKMLGTVGSVTLPVGR